MAQVHVGDQVGQEAIRGENIERAVKGFALQEFKMMQVLLVQTSNKWTETFYREGAAELTATDTRNIKGVARLAAFPHVDPAWEKFQGQHIKYAAEGTVSVEDRLTDNIDVQFRTILRVARAIANAVDLDIYTTLSGATGIGTAAAVATWDNPTVADRDPITDILGAIQDMAEQNYDALQNGFLLLNPKDYKNLLTNSKIINNPSFKTADVVSNGRVGQITGLTIIVSNSVTADEAMIIIGQTAATWRSAVPLTSAVIEDKGIKFTIRSWQIGQTQIYSPRAIFVVTNTAE